ncbi:MAG: tRNA pseudouridine38-40 synthase [Acidimicrobiaceae bacterium]|jgi:tRNA pseudouridine38-40 synthase|nr:tRNA pseudouridine38-40 synthase [Acidimicrobiaceae bacterium]
MTVAYDGGCFHGFAENVGVTTVAGALSAALGRVLRHPVSITGAGRTDAGVHAVGQVVSFDTHAADLDLDRVQRSINKLCAPAVAVRDVAVAPPGFDARFSARWRRYRYTILNSPTPDPFLAATAWHVDKPLDRYALVLACDPFIGEHDFSTFCRRRRGDPEATMTRRVTAARWEELPGDILRFEITANAFCNQMVRSIVGTMVDAGVGRHRPGELLAMLRSRNRHAAGNVAPPHGLCLWEVGYDDV